MDMDAFDSDEDMTLNIIDPPTIYGDDDDMEFTTSDDLPFSKSILYQQNESLDRKDDIMEGTHIETKIGLKNGFDKTDSLQGSQGHSIYQAGAVISSIINETPGDAAHSQYIANMESSDASVVAAESMPSVLSLAKKFDMSTSNDKTRTKPVVPSKPANLSKKFIDNNHAPDTPQASPHENLKPPVFYDQNSLLEMDALNGYQSASDISDKGRERRRSFSDRSASFDEDSPTMEEEFNSGLRDLHRTNSEEEPLLSSTDSSPVLAKSWVKETSQEPSFVRENTIEHLSSEPVGMNGTDASMDFPTNHSVKNSLTSNADECIIIPSNEIPSVYAQSSSRKSSIGSSNKDEASNDAMEMERNVFRRKWSSFSSTSSDENVDAKKVNIVKLMRERTLTQSDGNIDDDDRVHDNFNFIENGVSTSDDGLKLNYTADINR